jgi:hypothetical protein
VSGSPPMFDPSDFGSVFGPLLEIDRVPDLGPGVADESNRPTLEAAARDGFAFQKVHQPMAAKAFAAGLWLLFDFLDESHEISQSLPDEWGAYWHGIMHRREPDPGNATYWFRRVRANPIEASLKVAAADVDYNYRDPFEFIQDCKRHRGTEGEQERRLKATQLAEIRLLLQHHFDVAVGSR